MTCGDVRKRLSEHLEGDLEPEEAESIGAHLSSCERCRGEAEELSKTIRSVAKLLSVEPPPGFSARVMTEVREIQNKKRGSFWSRLFLPSPIRIPAQLTALFIVGVIGIVIYQGISPLPVKKEVSSPPKTESFQKKDTAQMARAKKKEQMDAPAFSKPGRDSDALRQKSNALDEVALLNPTDAEPFQMETKDDGLTKAPGEEELEKSVGPKEQVIKEQALAPTEIELVLTPYGTSADRIQLENKIAALVKEVGGNSAISDKTRQESKRSRSLSTGAASIYITIPENQIGRFKTLLAKLGQVNEETDTPKNLGFSSSADTSSPLSIPSTEDSKVSSLVKKDEPPAPVLIKITLTPPKTP